MKSLVICAIALFGISVTTLASPPTESAATPISMLDVFQGAPRDATNLLLPLASDADALQQADKCCKVCTTGKACGDSCISRKYQCHQPPGCACDG